MPKKTRTRIGRTDSNECVVGFKAAETEQIK